MTIHTMKDSFEKKVDGIKSMLATGSLFVVLLAGDPNFATAQSKNQFSNTPELVEKKIDQQKIDRIKKYITIEGKKSDSLNVKKNQEKLNTFEITFDYEFKNGEGSVIGSYPVTMEVSVQDVQNNSFVKFEKIAVSDVTMAEELRIKKINIFDINVTQDLPSQKSFDVRFVYNKKRSTEELEKKILAYDMKSLVSIPNNPDLENTQITGLNNIGLSKDIVHAPDNKSSYRPIFLWENGKYREIAKVYFDEKGDIDTEKTKSEMKDFSVLHFPIHLDLDFTNQTFSLPKEVADTLTNRVKIHRSKIKRCVENTRIGNPRVFVGLNNIGGNWEQTGLISLSLIDDTYTLQWGKTDSNSFAIEFSENNQLSFKDFKGDPIDTYTANVPENEESVFKEVGLVGSDDARKMVITNENSDYMPENPLPNLIGDVAVSLKSAKLVDVDPQKGVGYFQENGEKIAFIPATKNNKNQRKLGNLSEEVNTNDLLDVSILKAHILSSYNITLSDIYAAYEELMTKTGIPLKARKVVKVTDEKGGIIYDVVHQESEGGNFAITKDTELYQKASECNMLLAKNLDILRTITSTQLLCKEGDGEYDFHEYLGGQEGIGFHGLPANESNGFLKTNAEKGVTRSLSRNFTRGDLDEKDSQEIKFIIKGDKIDIDGKKKLFRKPSKTAGIEQKTYTITYNNESGSKLFFEVTDTKK